MIGNKTATIIGITGVISMAGACSLGMITASEYWTDIILLGIFMRAR